jgi:Uma2 family endonuclease
MARVTDVTEVRRITGEELAQMPDTGLCELINGRIVPMSPTGEEHGRIEGNVYEALKGFVRSHRLGKVLVGEVGIYTRRNPDSVRAADVLFISNERYARRSGSSAYLDVAPELVVEILSPRDTVMGLTEKLREYFAIDVRLVWVIDPKARRVYAYRALTDVREFVETDRLPGDDVIPGFEVPVVTLFEE